MDKETAEKLDEAANRFTSTHKVISIIECEYSFRQGAKWGIALQENKEQPSNGKLPSQPGHLQQLKHSILLLGECHKKIRACKWWKGKLKDCTCLHCRVERFISQNGML